VIGPWEPGEDPAGKGARTRSRVANNGTKKNLWPPLFLGERKLCHSRIGSIMGKGEEQSQQSNRPEWLWGFRTPVKLISRSASGSQGRRGVMNPMKKNKIGRVTHTKAWGNRKEMTDKQTIRRAPNAVGNCKVFDQFSCN